MMYYLNAFAAVRTSAAVAGNILAVDILVVDILDEEDKPVEEDILAGTLVGIPVVGPFRILCLDPDYYKQVAIEEHMILLFERTSLVVLL